MRNAICSAECIHLMPVCAFSTWIFREEFRAPAKKIRSQNAGHALHNLRPADNISKDRVIQVTIIVIDSGARLCVWIYDLAAVEKFKPHLFPECLDFVGRHQVIRTEKSSGMKLGQFFS